MPTAIFSINVNEAGGSGKYGELKKKKGA